MIRSLSVVIVNWNLKSDTIDCIQSLLSAGARIERIIVVDNGSSDGSAEAFRECFGPGLKIIETRQNIGLAAANNLGIENALAAGAEYLLILNNDTWVDANFFVALESGLSAHPEVSIFSPVIFYADQPEKIWYLGDRLIPGTMLTLNSHRGKPLKPGSPEVIPVDFVSGCAMLIHRKVFDAIGGFDASFFMYGEELDFCWQARLAGYRLATVTKASMWHKISASARKISPRAEYLRIRNQIWVYRRYSRNGQLLMLFPFTAARVCVLAIKQIALGRFELLSPLARGLWDGWFETAG